MAYDCLRTSSGKTDGVVLCLGAALVSLSGMLSSCGVETAGDGSMWISCWGMGIGTVSGGGTVRRAGCEAVRSSGA